MVVQRMDEKKTLLVFTEGDDIEKICKTLQFTKIWLGHSANTGCDVVTPKQMMMGDQLHWVGREESVSVEGINMQLPMLMPQCDISSLSVASQVVGKIPKFSTISGDLNQKGEVPFKQLALK